MSVAAGILKIPKIYRQHNKDCKEYFVLTEYLLALLTGNEVNEWL